MNPIGRAGSAVETLVADGVTKGEALGEVRLDARSLAHPAKTNLQEIRAAEPRAHVRLDQVDRLGREFADDVGHLGARRPRRN